MLANIIRTVIGIRLLTCKRFPPLIHYHFYNEKTEVESFIKEREEQIQVVVGKDYVDFGQAQCPMLNDYADGVDVMRFLEKV